jgi:hypothetical protein
VPLSICVPLSHHLPGVAGHQVQAYMALRVLHAYM